MALDVFENLLESGIVGHDVVPVSIFQLHSNVFPNLHSYCSIGEVAIEFADCGCSKIRLAKLKRVGSGDKCGMAMALAHNAQRILQLLVERLPVWVMVINEKNVEDVHMQTLEHCVETRVPSGNVSVGVDRLKQGERPHLGGREWLCCLRGHLSAGVSRPRLLVRRDLDASDGDYPETPSLTATPSL